MSKLFSYDLKDFRLQEFVSNTVELDFEEGVHYYFYIMDSNSDRILARVPFKIVCLNDIDFLIEGVYWRIYYEILEKRYIFDISGVDLKSFYILLVN